MNAKEIIANIDKIYEDLNIFPSIIDHSKNVAKIAKLICEDINADIDTNKVVAAALLHDLGNIAKIDLNSKLFAQSLEKYNEDRFKWEQIKKDQMETYGATEEVLTQEMMKEIGVDKDIRTLEKFSSWRFIEDILAEDVFERKILIYADFRVPPKGVSSLDERIKDIKIRYAKHRATAKGKVFFEFLDSEFFNLETQIFSETKINPDDINSKSVSKIHL